KQVRPVAAQPHYVGLKRQPLYFFHGHVVIGDQVIADSNIQEPIEKLDTIGKIKGGVIRASRVNVDGLDELWPCGIGDIHEVNDPLSACAAVVCDRNEPGDSDIDGAAQIQLTDQDGPIKSRNILNCQTRAPRPVLASRADVCKLSAGISGISRYLDGACQ